jgi:NAD(P)-dependent dehydrogenase (short-subunit alcohol dehydrogenase family)
MKNSQKVAIVTGCSSGFGMQAAITLANVGYYVIATIRNMKKDNELRALATESGVMENINITQLDVTDEQSVEAFAKTIKQFEKVDVLVNNAGYACAGFLEELPLETVKKQFETNLFGVVAITKLVIPYMRKQQSGHIINMSSISGLVGFPGLSPYVSSKHALEGLSESLRLELSPFQIKVVVIEPGSFKTNIWSIRDELQFSKTSPYSAMGNNMEQAINQGYRSFGDPKDVANLILKIASNKNPKLRYTIGKQVNGMLFLKRLLPWKVWEKLVLRNINK